MAVRTAMDDALEQAVTSGAIPGVVATAADDTGVVGVQFRLDGAPLGAEDTTSPYSVSWNTTTASAGQHALTAVARDAAGNILTSSPVTVTVNNNSLVAAYGFEEASGLTAIDSSGVGNTGTLENGVARTGTGRLGAALTFDGTDDAVRVANAPSLGLTTGLTVEGWVYPTALGTSRWRTLGAKERSGGFRYALFANDNQARPQAAIYAGGSVRTARGGAQLPLNTWSHLAMTYNGSVLRLYVNGVQAASTSYTGSIATGTGVLRVGNSTTQNNRGFQGRLDEVRVYNRALTAAQITADMNQAVVAP